jgi:hypothetical protein
MHFGFRERGPTIEEIQNKCELLGLPGLKKGLKESKIHSK